MNRLAPATERLPTATGGSSALLALSGGAEDLHREAGEPSVSRTSEPKVVGAQTNPSDSRTDNYPLDQEAARRTCSGRNSDPHNAATTASAATTSLSLMTLVH